MQGSITTSPPHTPRPSRTQHLSGTHVPPLPHGSPPGTDPPARHAQGDVLLGGPPVAPTARPRGSQPGAVREAVGQRGEHLLLLLGAAQALVVASLAHGWGRGGGSERGALRRRPRLPGGGEGWSRVWDHMAESCCSSGKQREGEGDRGDGGEGGRADGCRGEGEKKKIKKKRRKEKGSPLGTRPHPEPWHRRLPPGSAACVPAVPPGTRARRRWQRWWWHRRPCWRPPSPPSPALGSSGEQRPAAAALRQAGWGRGQRAPLRGAPGGRGEVGSAASSPASLPLRAPRCGVPAEGEGMLGEDGCSAASRQRGRAGASSAG